MKLPSVTLLCVDCVDPIGAAKVLDICTRQIEFGAVKLLTDKPVDSPHRVEIPPLNTLVMYSVFMLTRVNRYIDTPNVLIVQRDGWVLNPSAFRLEWLDLDYIAPLFIQYDRVGSGGFSLRSKRIMDYAASIFPAWDGTEAHADLLQKDFGLYEDGVLSMSPAFSNFKLASKEQAADFGQGGNRNPAYFREYPFGFHRTFSQIDFKTGRVDFSDLSRDLQQGYMTEINELHDLH